MSTTPIADQITAELAALKAAGFTDNQAKTIIVARAMESANLSKDSITPPEARKLIALIDVDEDKWVPAGPGADAWVSLALPLSPPRPRGYLEHLYGPLVEVFA